MKDYFLRYVSYNQWANDHFLSIMVHLTPEQLHSKTVSDRTAFETLQHMLVAETLWRCACQEESSAELIEQIEALKDLESIRPMWQAEHERLLAFVTALSEPDFDRIVTARWSGISYRIGDVILHLVSHSGIHRNELGWHFTSYVRSTGDRDYLDYIESLPG